MYRHNALLLGMNARVYGNVRQEEDEGEANEENGAYVRCFLSYFMSSIFRRHIFVWYMLSDAYLVRIVSACFSFILL